jgi:hypothetical protein
MKSRLQLWNLFGEPLYFVQYMTTASRSLTTQSPGPNPVPNLRPAVVSEPASGEDVSASGPDGEVERRSDLRSDTEVSTKIVYDIEDMRRVKRRKLWSADGNSVHSSTPPSNSPPDVSMLTRASFGISISSVSIPASATKTLKTKAYLYSPAPPSTPELLMSTDQYHIQSKTYRDPYYSKESDAPEKPREYAGLLYRLKGGRGLGVLEEWHEATSQRGKLYNTGQALQPLEAAGISGWEFSSSPPSLREAQKWLKSHAAKSSFGNHQSNPRSQVSLRCKEQVWF